MNRAHQHKGCGGGVEFDRLAFDGKPQFKCSKCGKYWTSGRTGGEWTTLAPYVIGFTGTRAGMNDIQKKNCAIVLQGLRKRRSLVGLHGDCIGADADFDAICKELGIRTFTRPCTLSAQRAYTDAEEIAPPIAPLDRNRLIVDDCDYLIGTPKQNEEQYRGGTWYTLRHAERMDRLNLILRPDGVSVLRTERGDITYESLSLTELAW